MIDLHSRDKVRLSEQSTETLRGLSNELGHFLKRRLGQLAPNPLTARELEVLKLAADGSSALEIARRLGVERSTIKTHFDHIYDKFGVSDRAAAVAHALRGGLIE